MYKRDESTDKITGATACLNLKIRALLLITQHNRIATFTATHNNDLGIWR
ncbi:MAG: hypothetical protein JWQ34_3611 [Mucilaginibacter sp.]|nr:hypothetical protein [Mucilaginibacter sp.]